MKNIDFFSKAVAEEHKGDLNAGLISITNGGPRAQPANLEESRWRSVIRLEFDDYTPAFVHKVGFEDKDYVLMSDDQAKDIFDWLEENNFETVFVHCEAGISRSAAVARFLGELIGFQFPYNQVKFANLHVYETLAKVWILRQQTNRYRDNKGQVFEEVGRGRDNKFKEVVVLRLIRGTEEKGTLVTEPIKSFSRKYKKVELTATEKKDD